MRVAYTAPGAVSTDGFAFKLAALATLLAPLRVRRGRIVRARLVL